MTTRPYASMITPREKTMNKIDGFFVMASLYLVWLFAIFLVPFKIMMFVFITIAAWAVGVFIARVPGRLAKETDSDNLEKMFVVLDEQNKTMAELLRCLELAYAANQSCLAKIDELMFEYCPEDMTPERIANYKARVKAVNHELH